jgi:tetratricopeptide (TPR) repeat protein
LAFLAFLPVVASPQIIVSSSLAPATYVVAVGEYRNGNRQRALTEIRRWRPRDVAAGVAALREGADKTQWVILPRGKVNLPGPIDVGAVEAAALMHVEAGLLELQELRLPRAGLHFSTATRHVEWLYGQKAERLRLLEQLSKTKEGEEPDHERLAALSKALAVDMKIAKRPFFATLAAATLTLGFPESAVPFAEKALAEGPPDGETLLLVASAKESLSIHEAVRGNEGRARKLRQEAEPLFRDAANAPPQETEARLRLGGLLLAEGRAREAEPFLQRAADGSDPLHHYLALLFLGRAAERQEKPDLAAGFYRRALEVLPESQAARFGLARCLEASGGPAAARPLVTATLADSAKPGRERDPWWSYSFGPRGLAKTVADRLWQTVLGRPFGA